jgi:anti-sigma factor RsiW
MKNCDETKAALVELVFGEPASEVEMPFNQHLASCPTCRDEERRLLGLRDAVRGEDVKPDEKLRSRIRAALPRRLAPSAFGFLGRPIPAYVAVAACLLGALLVLVLPSGERSGVVPARDVARSRGVAVPDKSPPFTAAGSYDTGVMLAGPVRSNPDSSGPESWQRRDSL